MTFKPALNYTQEARIQRAINQQRILLLTQLSWEAYCNFQYNAGLDYLESLVGSRDSQIFRNAEQDAEFWAWWKLIWSRRDEQFLRENEEGQEYMFGVLDSYELIHRSDHIELFPPKRARRAWYSKKEVRHA